MMVQQTHYAQLLHQPILGCCIFVATPGRLNDFLKGERESVLKSCNI